MKPLPLPPRETLTIEFKSDTKRLHDDELVETVIAMANTEGSLRWRRYRAGPRLRRTGA